MKLASKTITGGSTQKKHSLKALQHMHQEYRRLAKLRNLLLEGDRVLAVDQINCVVLPQRFAEHERKLGYRQMRISTPISGELSKHLAARVSLHIDERLEELAAIFHRHAIQVETLPKSGVTKLRRQPQEGDPAISDEGERYTIHAINYTNDVPDEVVLVTDKEPEHFIPVEADDLEWNKVSRVWTFIF